MMRALALAVERQARTPKWRLALEVAGLVVIAVLGYVISLQAAGPHTVDAYAQTSSGLQQVSVQAHPTTSASTLAVAGLIVSSVSALAAVGGSIAAFLALKTRPARR